VSRNRLQGDIEFRNVSFTYPEASTAVVANVSLRIRRGERVALIGRVGSGKTTLEKLVLGLYRPAEGAVLVDGIDIRQLDPAELRRNIGYVPQDVTLFFGSLRENLTLAAPDVDDERIVEAARIAGLLDFVNRHPEGFEMQVGERGEGLSGGQRQQVAIARAILHDPAILLLDEPTASMDQGTENDIKRRLGEFSAGRTLVVVTHRTSLLDLVDRVIVLDSGRVVADGPKVEVIEALRQGRVGRSE
jgi:ATP-binding cassette, subfamily C, bacterial LapB